MDLKKAFLILVVLGLFAASGCEGGNAGKTTQESTEDAANQKQEQD